MLKAAETLDCSLLFPASFLNILFLIVVGTLQLENFVHAQNECPGHRKSKILEPVSSTSRRVVLERRTMTSIPEISARGSLIL